MSGFGKPWTEKEMEILRLDITHVEAARRIPNRTEAGVKHQRKKMGIDRSGKCAISQKRPWQEWELALLDSGLSHRALARKLRHRSPDAVRMMRKRMGYNRFRRVATFPRPEGIDETIAEIRARRRNRAMHNGNSSPSDSKTPPKPRLSSRSRFVDLGDSYALNVHRIYSGKAVD